MTESSGTETPESGPVERYRIHMIISSPDFRDPRSFRTEAYARSSQAAAQAAVNWLGQQPLRPCTIMSTTIERVPKAPEGNF